VRARRSSGSMPGIALASSERTDTPHRPDADDDGM
jgi:hypothetical protein